MRKKSLKIIALLLIFMLTMVGCSSFGKTETSKNLFKPGTYTATSQGKEGAIKVNVTFSETSIDNIEVVEHHETPGTSDPAFEKVASSIIEGQTLAVDAVSGATTTSNAIIKAVEDCVVQAGGDLEALKIVAKETKKSKKSLEADIVVVGSGIAGMSTAISALQNGASVIVVEKQAALGRSFITSFGNVMMAQVEENKEFHKTNSDDTLDKALERWKRMTNQGGKEGIEATDYNRIEDIIVESGETIAWAEKLGVPFEPSFTKEQRGADIVKVTPKGDEKGGARLVDTFISKLNEYGATVLSGTAATELVEKNGKVIGIKATSKDTDYEIKAKSVVLATGGFGGSEDYVKELIPDIAETEYQFSGTGANKGDGMTMAKKVGAAIYKDSWIIPSPQKLLPSKKLTDENVKFKALNAMSKLEGGVLGELMLVNKNGKRITNEAGEGVVMATDLIDAKKAPYYVLFDSSNPEIVSLLDSGLNTGDIFKADDIKELEKLASMDSLVDTFNNYQAMAKAGEDTEFNKPAAMLKEYSPEGSYYLVRFVQDFIATMGGLKTTEQCQVIREDNTPIEGLYAVGEVAHRFLYNRAHFGNASNSASLTMGRTTGKLLAEKAKGK